MSDFETKYIARNAHALKIRAWLDAKFQKDIDYPETIISSVYFDDYNMSYLNEKDESDHVKSKFRIRWYEDIKTKKASEICFLEFKHKIGEKRFKKRIKVPNTYSDIDLESTLFGNAVDDLRRFEGNILGHVYPSYTVSYTRHRYIVPGTNIRLCIDSNIHIKKNNKRLIKKTFKRKYLDHCVFELKGETALLPGSLNFIEQLGLKKDSFSKYEQCFRQLIE
jgi:SPX domain protein involved in polyphosphate accumulation